MVLNRRLVHLSNVIQENTSKVDGYIQEKGLPEPSFHASYPPMLQLSPEVEKARNLALEALDELRDHLLGPLGTILNAIHEIDELVGLHGVTNFDMAKNLPMEGTMTIPELAKASNMHPDDAARIVRTAASRRIFNVTKEGNVEHSASSAAIIKIPYVTETCKYGLWAQWGAGPHVVPAMEKWPGSQELNQTAYNIAHQTDLTFFEHLGQCEKQARYFAEAMQFLAMMPQLKPDFVLEYDWGQHENGTVVDLGGSTGAVGSLILGEHPNIKMVVQDRAEVIALATSPKENISFQVHDLLAPQPVHGADVYFMRWILHDWPDKYCVRILQALKPALKPKARVVIMDVIAPEPGQLSLYQERKVRDFDIVMKSLFNAKERTESEWRNLVSMADEEGKFNVVNIFQPTGSQLGFLVLEWTG